MKMKMTKNSIKEIENVNSTIQCIKDTCPFPLDDSWRISDGIKNGKKFEIDGPLYPHKLDVFEDFETDKITLGLSISTCSRMNRKGDYVRYPKEYEMGKACVLEEVLLENLRELKPQLKYFTIDIDDYGLEDDGDNGWEHWMGFVLTPIQSVFEKEKEEEETRKRHELHVRIYDTVEKMPLTKENIIKLLKFDNEISGFDRVAKISNNKIYDYGKMKNPDYIDDTIPCSMTFKEYLNHFYASSSWGIEGYGYDEKDADEISKMFDDLKLDLGDKMDYDNIRKTMIEKTKNMEMTKENMEKIIAFENATYKNIGVGACTYEINEEKQTIKLISGPNDLDWEVVEEVYPIPFQGYIEKLCRCIPADIDDEMLKEVMRDFVKIELTYNNSNTKEQKEVDKMDYIIHQIGNVLKILESCNLLSHDDNNREEIKEIQKACEKILERYNGNRFGLEDLKDYFDKETYKKVEEALEGGEETTFELEYGQADGIWHNVIYIITNYEEPKTVTINEDYDKYNPVEMVLEGETRFEILLDPMRCITCVEDHGGIGSYFDKFKPNDDDIETLNKEDLANKLLNKINIERMEEKGWIGPDKSLEDISGQFNDVFLETIWEDDIRPFWDAILNEAAKRYMESLPKEKTREEIIDKIIESCEEDLTRNAVEKVCEWLVENSKHIRQHFLCVGDIQHYINGNIHHVGGVFLYSETDGDDTIIDLDTWAYYEKIGQGDNFSKEKLKELYEKL